MRQNDTPTVKQRHLVHVSHPELHFYMHVHTNIQATMIVNECSWLNSKDNAHFRAEEDRSDKLSHALEEKKKRTPLKQTGQLYLVDTVLT